MRGRVLGLENGSYLVKKADLTGHAAQLSPAQSQPLGGRGEEK